MYEKQQWANGNPDTPLSAGRLLHMEQGISDALDRPSAFYRDSGDDLLSALFGSTQLPDDVPKVTWSDGLTSSFASPVTVRPSIVGTGAKVTSWNSKTGTPDPNFFFDPGIFSSANGGSQDLEMHGDTKPGGSAQAASWFVAAEFVTSETDAFELGFYTTGQTTLQIEVGGVPMGVFRSQPGLATGKKATVTFPVAARRHIRLVGLAPFYGVFLKTGQTISRPTLTRRYGAIIGDSYVNGAGGPYGLAAGNAAANRGAGGYGTYASRLLTAMGSNSHILAGIGGTGLVATSPTSHYQTRAQAVVDFAPNFLVITGSVNDPSNGAGVQAALEQLLASTSSIPERYVMTVTRLGWEACNAAIRAAVAAHGNGVKILEMEGVLDGTGNTVGGGTGARGLLLMEDNSHPTLAGHAFLLRQATRRYRELLAA